MPTRIIKTYQKRIDEEGNDVLDENGQVIMDVIAETEEEYVEEPPTPSDFLQALSPEVQTQIARLLGYGLK